MKKAIYIGRDTLKEVPSMVHPVAPNFDTRLGFDAAYHEYKKQLAACKSHPINGNHSFEVGNEYVEGVDYYKEQFVPPRHISGLFSGWTKKEVLKDWPEDKYPVRIVAIPYPKSRGRTKAN